MSGSELLTTKQLKQCCDSVEGVLEALRDHADDTLTYRSRILPLVKTLFTSLQKLEDDGCKADGAFRTADGLARSNLAGVLTQCSSVADQLHDHINRNTLRHDDKLGRQLTVLSTKIENFLKLRKKKSASTARSSSGPTSDSTALVEDLLREQQKHQSKLEELEHELRASYEHQNILQQQISDRDARISDLESHNDAKLCHIRRLHKAISNLNSRHHMPYQTNDWDDLSIELPSMVQKIEDIDMKLKEFEVQRDRLEEQENESEDDESVGNGMPRAPKPPPAVTHSKLSSTKGKAREGDKDTKKKDKRASTSEVKPSIKVRSPSPTPSDATSTKTYTSSKPARRKSRLGNSQGSLFGL